MFQKYISVPKNSEGIYEYDTGVQGSENLSFYSLPKNEFEFLINNKIFGYLNDKGSLMIDDYESEKSSVGFTKTRKSTMGRFKRQGTYICESSKRSVDV